MLNDIFRGELVRLAAEQPETVGKAFSVWDRDSEYQRLLDNQPPRLWSAKKLQEFIEKENEEQQNKEFAFFIRKLEGRERGVLSKGGSRADFLIMGILREEWRAMASEQLNVRSRAEVSK